MLNLLKVAVVDRDNLEDMINSGDCKSIEDCPFDIAQGYDYAQTAFIDADRNYIIYWNDNIHSDPDMYIEAFTNALEYIDIKYKLTNIVMTVDDVKNKYQGAKY